MKNLEEFSKDDLICALKKVLDQYPATYRNFFLTELSYVKNIHNHIK